jgi:hypothetical protein
MEDALAVLRRIEAQQIEKLRKAIAEANERDRQATEAQKRAGQPVPPKASNASAKE